MKNLVLFGPPGAGKGTQSALLVKQCNYFQISTGDLLRSAIKEKTKLGMEAQSYMDKGALVPDDLVINLVDEVLSKLNGKSFILDGFPRTKAQAIALDQLLLNRKLKIDLAVFLEVENKKLVMRLSGRRVCQTCGAVFHIQNMPPSVSGVCDNCGGLLVQRPDDVENVIEERLRTYAANTAPLRDFFKESGVYVEIKGDNSAELVFGKILELIK